MLKVGLIGVGGMGAVHLGQYKSIDDVKICAIADVRTDMAKEKADDNSIKIYSDYKEMIEAEELDFVDICTPSYLHAEMAEYALLHNLHVLCEKPMVLCEEDGKRVLAAREKSHKFFMTAHVVRFMNPYIYLADVIKSARLGNPVHLSFSRVSEIPRWSWENWMMTKERSGLTPYDLNIHDVDFMQSLFGMPKAINSTYHELSNDSDYILTDYQYDGFIVSTEAAWYKSPLDFDASYRAVFEKGTVIFKYGKLTDCGKEVTLEVPENNAATGINIKSIDGYGGEIRYFVDCIKSGKAPEAVTPQSSLGSVLLIRKTLEACKKM